MKSALLWGLFTGCDNLQVGAALGLLPIAPRRRVELSLSFGVAELGMTLVGWGCHLQGSNQAPSIVALAVAAALAVLGWARGADLARLAGSRAALTLLPLVLSFDNLAAGVGLASPGSAGLRDALAAGILSAASAAIGQFGTGALAARLPRVATPVAGVLLLGLAAVGLLEVLA